VSATLTVQYDRVLYLLDGHFKFSDFHATSHTRGARDQSA
jgi:hypothetical protein